MFVLIGTKWYNINQFISVDKEILSGPTTVTILSDERDTRPQKTYSFHVQVAGWTHPLILKVNDSFTTLVDYKKAKDEVKGWHERIIKAIELINS